MVFLLVLIRVYWLLKGFLVGFPRKAPSSPKTTSLVGGLSTLGFAAPPGQMLETQRPIKDAGFADLGDLFECFWGSCSDCLGYVGVVF